MTILTFTLRKSPCNEIRPLMVLSFIATLSLIMEPSIDLNGELYRLCMEAFSARYALGIKRSLSKSLNSERSDLF